MCKRNYWQDWAVLGVILAIALILSPGCVGPAPQPSTEFPCGPKVLIFYAEWCHWCPTLDQVNQLQTEFPNCEVIAIDVDRNPNFVREYHITRIPRYFICDEYGCRTTTSFQELRAWLSEL